MKQKKHKNHAGLMKEFSRSLPALLRARSVQERAKGVGFEWSRPDECFQKLLEEIRELKKAYKKGCLAHISA